MKISYLNTIERSSKGLLFMAVILLLSVRITNAQSYFKLSGAKENTIKVSGKSNVHDWSMNALGPIAEADFGMLTGEDGVPQTLTSLSFSVNAKSLKSEHASMDARTYKLLKSESNPKIGFKLSNATISPNGKGKFSVKANGNLTIAGVTKTVGLLVNGEVKSDQSITCSGSYAIKLTDYGMQPPSFMLGAMKVTNDVVVNYSLNFKK